MENQEFVSFRTAGNGQSVKSEHFFRKDKVNYFGVTERNKGSDYHSFDVRITYETSDASSDTFHVTMPDTAEFEMFRDQMLDTPAARAEEMAKIRNGLSHMDAPVEPGEEPASVTRDSLEITEGTHEFFKWLHGKFFNSEKLGNWHFKAVPGTDAEDFIVCHKANTVTSPADVHISFRNQHEFARVSGIVIMDHYTPDDAGFNLILHEFVRDILRPYADNHRITYSYAGTPSEQLLKSNGIIENTQETTKEEPVNSGIPGSFVIPDNANRFYYFLLSKATYFDDDRKWSVTRRDTLFDCRCMDLDTKESFTVTISFTIDTSYARVTEIQADGSSISVDQYNHYLCRFVNEMVKPVAEIEHFRYDFFIDSYKNKGTNAKVNTDTLDSLEITGEAEGFYDFLLAEAERPDWSSWSVSREEYTKFTCTRADADATNYFTVTVSFTPDGRHARVTAIDAIGTYLDADRYNRFLRRFVTEIVKPYAEAQKLTYRYSGKC